MAQDPFDEELRRRERQQQAVDPFDAELARRESAPSRFGRGLIRAGAQGATFGFGEEIEAGVRAAFSPRTYEEILPEIRREMREYSGAYPGTALAAELAGGLALGGGAGALRSGAVRAGTGLAARAARGAAAAAGSAPGRAITSGPGQAAIGGFGSAEGDLGDRALGAALGGVVGAALPAAGKAVMTKAPFLGQATGAITGPISRGYTAGMRSVANALEGAGMPGGARFLEPQDAIRATRVAGEALPGGLAGPTARSIAPETGGARETVRQARERLLAQQQERLAAEQALGGAVSAEEAARTAAQTQFSSAKQRLAQSKAQRTQEVLDAEQLAATRTGIGVGRAGRLTAEAKRLERQARGVGRQAAQEISDLRASAVDEARSAVDDVLRQVQDEAATAVGGLRAGARGQAAALQRTIRGRQTAVGNESYRLVKQVGAPPDPDGSLVKEILADPTLRRFYGEANEVIRKEMTRPEALQEGLTTRRIVSIDGQDVPEVTLYGLDLMRRRVREAAQRVGPNVTGISASQRNEALGQIARLEQRFLAGFGTDDAAQALRTARAKYRAEFELLEALQDGATLGAAKATRVGGLIVPSPKQLDEVVKRVNQKVALAADPEASDDVRQAAQAWVDSFRVGAKAWFDNAARESPDGMAKFAGRFRSEAAQERLALAFGDDAVDTLRAFFPEAVEARTRGARRSALEQNIAARRGIAEQTGRLRAETEARAERAKRLAEQAEGRGTEAQRAAQQLRLHTRASQRADIAAEELAFTPLREALATATTARRQASGARRVAGMGVRTAQQELRVAQEALRQAKSTGQDLQGAIGQALTNPERAADAARIIQTLDPAQLGQAREVLGSMFQRRIQQMAARGRDFEAIQREVLAAQQNPAIRALMRAEIDAARRGLAPSFGAQLPGIVGAVPRGFAGRFVGGRIQGQEEQP